MPAEQNIADNCNDLEKYVQQTKICLRKMTGQEAYLPELVEKLSDDLKDGRHHDDQNQTFLLPDFAELNHQL